MPAFGIIETAPIARDFPGCIDNCQTFAEEHEYFRTHPHLKSFYRGLMCWERDPATLAQDAQATGVLVQHFGEDEVQRIYCDVVVVEDKDSETAILKAETPTSFESYSEDQGYQHVIDEEYEQDRTIPNLLRFVGAVPLLDIPLCTTAKEVEQYEDSVYQRFPDWEGFFRVLAPCEMGPGTEAASKSANAVFVCREFGGFVHHYISFSWLKEKGTCNG